MRDYLLAFLVIILAHTNAEYFYPKPSVEFSTPGSEYLPPEPTKFFITTTLRSAPLVSIAKANGTTTTTEPTTTTPTTENTITTTESVILTTEPVIKTLTTNPSKTITGEATTITTTELSTKSTETIISTITPEPNGTKKLTVTTTTSEPTIATEASMTTTIESIKTTVLTTATESIKTTITTEPVPTTTTTELAIITATKESVGTDTTTESITTTEPATITTPKPTIVTEPATTTTPKPNTITELVAKTTITELTPTTTATTNPEIPYSPDSDTFQSDILVSRTTTTPKPASTTEHEHEHHHHHEDMPFWDFRESIPGDPEQDYPILDKIPATKFTCNGRIDGYYADLETRCQVFHVCSKLPGDQYIQNSFLCPNGTIFQQETFSCQWWPDVECALSTEFYELNARIGIAPQSGASSSIKEIIVPAPKDVLFDSERQEEEIFQSA